LLFLITFLNFPSKPFQELKPFFFVPTSLRLDLRNGVSIAPTPRSVFVAARPKL